MRDSVCNFARSVVTLVWMVGLSLPSFARDDRTVTTADDPVAAWIRQSAIPIRDGQTDFGKLDQAFAAARVIGLGEATHGQHEVFELKRQLTMHLIQRHGVRLVAYEASVSEMAAARAYVDGTSDDRKKAIGGFGMLIWQVEENGALLDSLREWNRQAAKADRVRLIGCDAQDGDAVLSRLSAWLKPTQPALIDRAVQLKSSSQKAIGELMSGQRANWEIAEKQIVALKADLEKHVPKDAEAAFEYSLAVHEFVSFLSMYATQGGRDKAMAELLLKQLEHAGPQSKLVCWAHNAHLQLSPMSYRGTNELAQGGHLRNALGDKYYALGVAFGEGEFQANIRLTDGKWGFRRYTLSAAPKDSLEAKLALAGHAKFALDLRSASKDDAVQTWLKSGHGHRWLGGYMVPDDIDERTKDASKLMKMTPKSDFDGLLYVAKTSAAKPINEKLIVPPAMK